MFLNTSSNANEDSNDEINFPHKSLQTDAEAAKLPRTFGKNLTANVKL